VNPVIIDRDFNVLAGHGRIEAAKQEGMSEVPCVFAEDMTEAQIAENIDAIIDVLDRNLEQGSKQIKAMYLKTTMGPVTRVI
jgi:ribosomal protein L1